MKYYKLIGGFWPTGYKIGKIYPEDWQREAGCIIVSKLYRDYPTEWKLSTKAAYNKQEGITVKPKQTKLKQTEMENYSIEGSKALKTAFVEECKLKVSSITKLDNTRILISEGMPIGTIQSMGNGKASQHFILPKDWEAAVKYVTEFNTPKVVFKNGDYVVVLSTKTYNYGKSCGETRPVVGELYIIDQADYTDGLIRLSCPNSNKITINPKELRLATPAEIKKATKVVFKAGDWVTCVPPKVAQYEGAGYEKGLTFKINEIRGTDCAFPALGGNGVYLNALRLATPDEIKAVDSPVFKMAGYDSVINKLAKTISFGCQTYTKAEVKLLLDAAKLCERVGYSAKVKASGFVVSETDILTPDNLIKIFKLLK